MPKLRIIFCEILPRVEPLTFLAPHFRVFQWRLCALLYVGVLGSCPAGPPLNPALAPLPAAPLRFLWKREDGQNAGIPSPTDSVCCPAELADTRWRISRPVTKIGRQHFPPLVGRLLTFTWYTSCEKPTQCFTLTFRPLNPNVAADGQSYFHFKCPGVLLNGTVFSLSSINRRIQWDVGDTFGQCRFIVTPRTADLSNLNFAFVGIFCDRHHA